MYSYTFMQWLLFFYFYCFVGWCFESTYVSIRQKKLVNRGFMRGPYLPIYGTGAITILIACIPFRTNLVIVFFAGMLAATLLELVTGYAMERMFKVRYWDYSNQKLNFRGYICLSSSIAWGGMSVLLIGFLHTGVESLIYHFTAHQVLSVLVTFVLSAVILSDFIVSFKAAMELKNILVRLEKAKEEVHKLQLRMEELLEEAEEEIATKLESVKDGAEELADTAVENAESLANSVTEAIAKARENYKAHTERIENMHQNGNQHLDTMLSGTRKRLAMITKRMEDSDTGHGTRDEMNQIRSRLEEYEKRRAHSIDRMNFFKRDLIRNNPTAKSIHFHNNFEELKEAVANKRWRKGTSSTTAVDQSDQKPDTSKIDEEKH